MKLRYKLAGGFLGLLLIGLGALAFTISRTDPCPSPQATPSGDTVRSVRHHCYGGPEVLRLEQVAKPVPGDSEVLVRVRSSSVNPLDWHYMRGSPFVMRLDSGLGAPDDPRVGVDYSGVVEAVGPGVTRFKPGDAVFGGRSGAFGDYVLVPEDRAIAIKPSSVSFEQAGAVGIAGVTALQALVDHGRLQAGEKVLVNGASGGVGTFAVQIAKALGAEVTGVCSTRNVEMVRALGADHVVDYKKADFTRMDQQYDLIVDMVGNHPLRRLRDVLQPQGRLVIVGGAKGDWLAPLIGPVMAMAMDPFVEQDMGMMIAEFSQDDLEQLAEMMVTGKVKTQVDRVFPLARIAEAIAYSESGRARGKIIIAVD